MRTLAVPVELLEKIAADYESLSRSLDYKPERIACAEIASDVRALLAAPGVGEVKSALTHCQQCGELLAASLNHACETPAPEER